MSSINLATVADQGQAGWSGGESARSRTSTNTSAHPAPSLNINFSAPTQTIASNSTSQQPRLGTHTPPQPQRVETLRGALHRRRSSFPPATSNQISNPSFNADINPTVDSFAELGLPELASMWTPVGWDTLLSFDGDEKQDMKPFVGLPPGPSTSGGTMSRVHSDPGGDRPGNVPYSAQGAAGGSKMGMAGAGPASLEPGKLAQFGSDLAWKTILASQVEVEGVGQVGVARVLQEVWRRGGGEQVTTQGAWPSIIISLSLPETESPGFCLPSPSAHAALSLQNLYNLTLRHWEPSIFTGLLSSFGSPALRGGMDLPAMLDAAAQAQNPTSSGNESGAFGVSTPQKELDMSQWTTLTPGVGGDWSFLNTFDALSPIKPGSSSKAPGGSSLAFEFKEDRRGSTSRSTDADGMEGLNEILAQMEEGNEARDIAAVKQQIDAASTLPDLLPSRGGLSGRKRSIDGAGIFQMPTPETDSSDMTNLGSTDRNRQQSFQLVTPPSSNGSPFTPAQIIPKRPPGGQSALARHPQPAKNGQLATPAPSTQNVHRSANAKKNGMQLAMPVATFVPPPPMCMFFSPAFHDLQKGKVGVWKGDLEVRGKGGGKFSILIVGEEATGHFWQSQNWPSSVVYPPDDQANENATATATMIPVSHLAREGFTPAAMGMVLCNDANLEAYVQMVQGFHAEGVAFHLSTPSRLPIVFLPAKFDSSDPLQRLGVAYMTKPGIPHPASATMSTARSTQSGPSNQSTPATARGELPETDGGPKKKKRRQSAPASAMTGPTKQAGGAGRHRKRESVVGVRREGIPESVLEEKG